MPWTLPAPANFGPPQWINSMSVQRTVVFLSFKAEQQCLNIVVLIVS